jgi:hypothetical protein
MGQTTEEVQSEAKPAPALSGKKLLRFHVDCGRMGSLDGKFVLDADGQAELVKLYGETVNFGEVLGKHSDIGVVLKPEHIELVTDDHAFLDMAAKLRISLDSGFNPLDYVEEDDED